LTTRFVKEGEVFTPVFLEELAIVRRYGPLQSLDQDLRRAGLLGICAKCQE
jgi:hypothetical protein